MVFSMMAHRGAPGGDAIQQAAEHLGGVGLLAGGGGGVLAGGAAGHLPQHLLPADGLPGRQALYITPMARVWLPPKMEMRIFSPQVEDMGAPS